jgi:probable F420-dependent oxidoreductase
VSAGPTFGVVFPPAGPFGSPGVFGDVIDAIESLGYSDVWFGDHIAVPHYASHLIDPAWLEPITACTMALARTTRLRVGTDVLVVPYRHPVLLAKMAATADALSAGRLILGVGVGYLRGEFAALDAEYVRRGEVTDEHLAAMQRLWRAGGAPTCFYGTVVDFEDVCVGPAPVAGTLPIWVGGNARAALRRAARFGQGWHPLFPTPEEYRLGRTAIEDLRNSSDPFTWSISLATTKVLERGETLEATSWGDTPDIPDDFDYAPPIPMTEEHRVRFVGDADQVAEDVREYVAAGVEHFTLRFAATGTDVTVPAFLGQLERFAREVVPLVAEISGSSLVKEEGR